MSTPFQDTARFMNKRYTAYVRLVTTLRASLI